MRAASRLLFLFLILPVLTACQHQNKIYTSDCNEGHPFMPLTLTRLADSAAFYNNKFVELSGKFRQEKTLTVLTGDKKGETIMVEFSNECPLFLAGTRIGFFDYDNNNGQLTPANNKIVKLRGEVVLHVKKSPNQLKVSVAHISYVQF